MQSKHMKILKVALIFLLSAIAFALFAFASIIWAGNFLYCAGIFGMWWYLIIKKRHIAKFALVPLAALEAMPPYSLWLYIDNKGAYEFGFSRETFMTSLDGRFIIFSLYAAIFCALYFLLTPSTAKGGGGSA
jgi:hypothetical protein